MFFWVTVAIPAVLVSHLHLASWWAAHNIIICTFEVASCGDVRVASSKQWLLSLAPQASAHGCTCAVNVCAVCVVFYVHLKGCCCMRDFDCLLCSIRSWTKQICVCHTLWNCLFLLNMTCSMLCSDGSFSLFTMLYLWAGYTLADWFVHLHKYN